jgi:hypothetical protein
MSAVSRIRARLMLGTVLQSDETGLRVGKRNWWLWVFHHDDSAVFIVEPSRGKCVVATFLGEFRPDFWVSDRYGAQMGWAAKENQVLSMLNIRSDIGIRSDLGSRFGGEDRERRLIIITIDDWPELQRAMHGR